MRAKYLGFDLSSPIIVSSSPYTATLKNIEQCAASGAGAVVLKSIFEEQILHHATALGAVSESAYGDADVYLQRYLGDDYKSGFLQLVSDARAKTKIPIIASINCVADDGDWIEYASLMAQAGASALELNVFIQPTDIHASARDLEQSYARIVRRVAKAVKIPVSVKLPMRITNVFALSSTLLGQGARGVVFFNRFFEPDVDIERMTFVESSPYSEATELRNVLRMVAICSAVLPQLDLSVSTGVHDGEAAVKALLCGAEAVQVCTAIHQKGFGVIAEMNEFIDRWAERQGFSSLDEFRGRLNFKNDTSAMFQRVQYMKYFPSEAWNK
ncbi:MAG TPA: dihydroorotate dehydrogenase-like protein [Candidatus Alistipes avicola]|uniref:dihydrouracil dehydrogenase (NAD(+)) n=1 Tax=Candidatus Alistipes avicola TaxID=2838432 RepID=A0A9D2L432_9BACT|nr:dihydroorotate dehydrogenase-like protein [uncultured Alistipes sp.]HJA98872.1 dihydroorotate dehydrogenase-like protein [Candidatus Alistipes avicola]